MAYTARVSSECVSLVIPGRNCAETLRACLESVCAIAEAPSSPLREILFVDDGSTDDSRGIAASFEGVTVIRGEGKGPGHARNLGWRRAGSPLVWFMDSDCVAERSALALLMPHLRLNNVAAASGSYGNMRPESLLARLIHEEIIERHLSMGDEVNFLATFNVLYRRDILESLGGFDTRYLKGQDAELSYRCVEHGYRLRFELASRVGHFHEDRWLKYLRTQRQQGYWRVWLHLSHRGHSRGDSYSSLVDHVQPPLAMLTLAGIGTLVLLPGLPLVWLVPAAPAGLLLLLQLPLTLRIVARMKRVSYAMFAVMGFIRAFYRGVGMTMGLAGYMLRDRSWTEDES